MSIIECDSFDWYEGNNDIQLAHENLGWGGTNYMSMDTGNPRHGRAAWHNSYWNGGNPQLNFAAATQIIVGFALKCTSLPAATRNFLYFRSPTGPTVHASVQVLSDGKMRLIDANGGTIGTTAAQVVFAGTYHHFEFKLLVGNSGTFELRSDEVALVTGTGVDVQGGTDGTVNNIIFFDNVGAEAGHPFIDDFYIINMSDGVAPTDYIGDCIVGCFRPNGNGSSSQLAGSDGDSTDNYLLADDTVENGDTDYVQGVTVGDKDLYDVEDLVGPANIYGVMVHVNAKRTDNATNKNLTIQAKTGSDESTGAARVLTVNYEFRQRVLTQTPSGTAWSVANFNSAQFGVRADTGASPMRMTQLAVDVVYKPITARGASQAFVG